MKRTKRTISDWLKEYGDPEVDKIVERELEDIIEERINQRVIEELEKQRDKLSKVYGDMCEDTFYSYIGGLIEDVNQRIKELKQE